MSDKLPAVYETKLPNFVKRGKVRDVYDLGDRLMVVATDRISAFDVVMNEPVPGKGIVLTKISKFWFDNLKSAQPHHLDYVVDDDNIPAGYEEHIDQLRNRAMVCKKAEVLPIECIVRGYIIGSGWKDYQKTGAICGIELPQGLQLAQKLPEPIFTPTTKADVGHDEAVTFEQACEMAGKALMEKARQRSLEIYQEAANYAAERGIIIADTKFEFGVCDGEVILIDEVLTPDSSRFWPADKYEVGKNPPSFDKQFVRDYLNGLDWDKTPPAPTLPEEIISQTSAKYVEGVQQLTK